MAQVWFVIAAATLSRPSVLMSINTCYELWELEAQHCLVFEILPTAWCRISAGLKIRITVNDHTQNQDFSKVLPCFRLSGRIPTASVQEGEVGNHSYHSLALICMTRNYAESADLAGGCGNDIGWG